MEEGRGEGCEEGVLEGLWGLVVWGGGKGGRGRGERRGGKNGGSAERGIDGRSLGREGWVLRNGIVLTCAVGVVS